MTFDNLSDLEIFARTVWAEARGEGLIGMVSVANVIMNRVNTDIGNDGKPDWWGEGVRDVCLKPAQFSCWLKPDPNYGLVTAQNVDGQTYKAAMVICGLSMGGLLKDNTDGSTHYFSVLMDHTKLPDWSIGRTPVKVIGHHAFYKL